jgi:large subunit ribosomal protein L5
MDLKEKYEKEVVPKMIEKFGFKNKMAVPKIEKVVINTGFGKLLSEKTSKEREEIQNFILDELALISGQRPVLIKARKSISGFKVKKGLPIGAKVTLRKKRMYDFLERLINVGLPRCRDFWGIAEDSIDKNGNLTIGIKEHTAFPEISPEKAKFIFGFEITIVTTAKDRKMAIELFKLMGFPMKT